MKTHFCLLFVCVLVACGRSDDYVDQIIVFDNSVDYPELNLRLSDVADITYIPLKGVDEGYPVMQFGERGNNAYIDGDEIYFNNATEAIYVFDMSGKPVRKLDRRGRGPQEYGIGILDFWSEPDRNSVCVTGSAGMIMEYDAASFEFKSSNRSEFRAALTDLISLNRDYSIAYVRPRRDETAPPTFYLYSKPDWTPQPLSPPI